MIAIIIHGAAILLLGWIAHIQNKRIKKLESRFEGRTIKDDKGKIIVKSE